MIENVVTIWPSSTAREAAELMNKHDIGCLVVLKKGTPMGIVTERDMIKRIVHSSLDPRKTLVKDIMSSPVVSATPDMRAGDAARLMVERNVKRLPVVEERQLVGLVSLTDLVRSEGVIDFLNGISLKIASKRIARVVELYSDPEKLHRKKCPLTVNEGFQMACQDNKCMWWVGGECAVTKLSRNISNDETYVGIEEPSVEREENPIQNR